MIVSQKHQVIIANPTKTGTESRVSMLCGKGKFGEHVMPKHSMKPEPEWQDYEPYFIVRNPYARLVSMFNYLQGSETWFLSKYACKGWKPFLHQFMERVEKKPNKDWSRNFSTLFNELDEHTTKYVQVFTLENLAGFIDHLRQTYDPAIPKLKHINKSKRDRAFEEYWDDEAIELVADWVEPDCEKFGYDKLLSSSASKSKHPVRESGKQKLSSHPRASHPAI